MNGYPPRFPDPADGRPGDVPPAIPDPMDDPDLRDVAVAVRDVLHEHRMRPAARDQLRAQLIAAAAAQISPPQELRPHSPEPRTAPRPDHRTGEFPAAQRPATPRPAAERPMAGRPLAAPGTGRIPVGAQSGPQLSPQTGSHRIRPAGRTTPERPARQQVPSRPSSRRRPTAHRVPKPLGWSVIGAAAALVAVLAVLRVLPGATTYAVETVAAQVMPGFLGPNSADPADGVKMRFSQPLDQGSVSKALRISPAAQVTTSWDGDALTVAPVHSFAPNSAYVLTIDHTVAKTADGKSIANDVRVVFGTAPTPQPATAMGQTAKLARTDVAAAADGSEAVVTKGGSILLTSAVKRGNGPSGLVRVSGGSASQLANAAEAICVSRSGRSIAFVNRKNGQSQIVMADSAGNPQTRFTVQADQATPIGWINDDEVTFVSGGKLRALDRSGHIRLLDKSLTVDPAHDTLVIAPGGRYAYLARGTDAGKVIDLTTGTSHTLPRTEGAPAFSADGSTVVWIEQHDNNRRDLDSAASGGGPTLSVHLPDLRKDGDTLSDLSVSPDGSMVTYTVHHADKSAQLRLALLRSGVTIGESDSGPAQSPNWSSDGRMFTVLSPGSGSSKIQSVDVPQNILSTAAAAGAIAQAYANAQISGDAGAQLALSASGVKPPALSSQVSRATVVYVRSTGFGTSVATIRLGVDPTTTDPVRQATETLTLKQRNGNGLPQVTEAQVTRFAPAPVGPQLTRVDTETVPGAVLLTFDSDLTPGTVSKSVALVTATGQEVSAAASYDVASRTVTLQPGAGAASGGGQLSVVLTSSLQDIFGHGLPASTQFPVQLGSTGQ